jgi:hypothetical protein
MPAINPFQIGKLEITGKVLIISNAIAIILAILFSYSLAIIIWTYYLESLIIGLFTILTIITTGIRHRASLPKAISMGGFFALHYGFFHFVYLIFLSMFAFWLAEPGTPFYMEASDFQYIFLTAGILLLSHSFSFAKNILQRHEEPFWDADKQIDATFTRPYFRIIPLHITIIASGFVVLVVPMSIFLLVLFMGLKTLMDLAAHQQKHHFIIKD